MGTGIQLTGADAALALPLPRASESCSGRECQWRRGMRPRWHHTVRESAAGGLEVSGLVPAGPWPSPRLVSARGHDLRLLSTRPPAFRFSLDCRLHAEGYPLRVTLRALLPGPVVESEALVVVSPPAPVALYTTTGNKRCIISKRSSTLRPGRKVVSFPAAALQHSAAWSKVVSFPAAALYSAMMPLEAQQCVRAAAQAVSPWRLYRPASGCAAPALLLRAESC
jgi:hypothetical protein